LPEDFVIKYNLLSNKVEIAHFELIKSQEDLEFLLTPRLHINDIQSTNTFSKMKVSKTKNVFSTDVSSTFEFLSDENCKPEFLTTAFFVKSISKWFTLMTSRYCGTALSLKNKEKYNANVIFLREMINLFERIKISNKDIF